MIEEIRKLSLAALGTAAITYDKVVDLINDMVAKGRITVEEGRQLSEQLKIDLLNKAEGVKNKTNEKISEIKSITRQEVKDIIQKSNFATKDDIEALKNKILEIEKKLN